MVSLALLLVALCVSSVHGKPTRSSATPSTGTVWWSINTTQYNSLSNGWTALGIAVIYDSTTMTLLAIDPKNVSPDRFFWNVTGIAQYPLPVIDSVSRKMFAVRNDGTLIAIALQSGHVAWTTAQSVNAENSEGQSLVVAGSEVVVASSGATIVTYKASSGARHLFLKPDFWTPETPIRLQNIPTSALFLVSAFGAGFAQYAFMKNGTTGKEFIMRMWVQDVGNSTNVRFYPSLSKSNAMIGVVGKYFNDSSNVLDWWVGVYDTMTGNQWFRVWLGAGNIYQDYPMSIQGAPTFTEDESSIIVTYYEGHSLVSSGFLIYNCYNSSNMISSNGGEATTAAVWGKNVNGVVSYAYGSYDGLLGMMPEPFLVNTSVWSATLGAQVFHRPLFVPEANAFIAWGAMEDNASTSQIFAVFC